ncbi:hypothetical protein HDU76_010305 [Blyttiomyces sp. JEL0837]|nr:hypothetical protein HDU76_010305 [Blyttiomyces sp. JEL0837]
MSCVIKRFFSVATKSTPPAPYEILGRSFVRDEVSNVTPSILSKIPRRLHLVRNHPINIIKTRIEDYFHKTSNKYAVIDALNPAVSPLDNFDRLLVAADHPSRSPTDTYYLNSKTVLRTHTSAHQHETLASKANEGYLITADVYRRDEIDVSHYPVFHQMEGVRTFKRSSLKEDIEQDTFAPSTVTIVDETEISDSNPVQLVHQAEEALLISNHLKRVLEGMFESGKIVKFQPYSKYPACYKDVSFWCPPSFHDNDMFEVVRDVAGDAAEDVQLVSKPLTLTNEEVDEIQEKVRAGLVDRCKVELRG